MQTQTKNNNNKTEHVGKFIKIKERKQGLGVFYNFCASYVFAFFKWVKNSKNKNDKKPLGLEPFEVFREVRDTEISHGILSHVSLINFPLEQRECT